MSRSGRCVKSLTNLDAVLTAHRARTVADMLEDRAYITAKITDRVRLRVVPETTGLPSFSLTRAPLSSGVRTVL
jgi:thioesterase domain-containing protein